MVKILSDPFKELEEEKTIEEKKELHDKIEKQQVKTIKFLPIEEEKKVNQSVRLPESMLNTLKVYCKVHGKSINSVIEDYLTVKFNDKKIIRDRYDSKEETRILIPKETKLIKEYIDNKINLIVNVTESTDGTLKINQFDKQVSLFNNNPSGFQLINLRTTNNYLDKYDSKNECYYNEMFYHDIIIDSDFDTFFEEETKKYKNHVGLIALEHHEISTIDHPFNSYKLINIEEDKLTVDTDTATHITIFLLVHEYDNIIRTVRIISPEEALKLAEDVENTEIINYIKNNLEVATIIDILTEYEKEAKLLKQINLLEELNLKLTENNNNLKTELELLNKKLEDKNKENYNLTKNVEEEENNLEVNDDITKYLIDPEILTKLSEDIEENNKVINTYMEFMNTNIKKNLTTLQKLQLLYKYVADQQKLEESPEEEKLN